MSVVITILKPPAVPSPTVKIERVLTPFTSPGGGTVAKRLSYKRTLYGTLASITGSIGFKTLLTPSGNIPSTINGQLTTIKQTILKSYSASGTLSSITGTVERKLTAGRSLSGVITETGLVQKIVNKNLTGAFMPEGSVIAWKANLPELEGEITCSGTLVRNVQLPLAGGIDASGDLLAGATEMYEGEFTLEGALSFEVQKNLAGELVPLGSLRKRSSVNLTGEIDLEGTSTPVFFDQAIILGGEVSFSKRLTLGVIYDTSWRAPFTGKANRYDFTIEQGARFERRFRWLKEDGTPHIVTRYNLSMQLRAYARDEDVIASSLHGTIVIGRDPDGYFTVTIPGYITKSMNFTRAVYSIDATYDGVNAIRLLEGEVRFSADPTVIFLSYDQVLGGECALTSSLTAGKRYPKSLVGNCSPTGQLTSPPPKTLRGEIAGNRIYGNLTTHVTPGNRLGEITPSGALTKQAQINLSGSTGTLSGSYSWTQPTVFDGEITDITGDVTMVSIFNLVLSGTIETN